jgi:dTDP-4-dehydrorhamnose reductase
LVRLTRSELDICDAAATTNVIGECSPDIVINTAAYHDVDTCEDHPQEAFDHNAVAVHHLALACREVDALLVHFSTNFVFGGDRESGIPLSESDPVKPESVYAASKLAGEYLLQIVGGRFYIVRTSGLYGDAGCRKPGSSFVEKVLTRVAKGEPLEIVNDQHISPTAALDLAAKVMEMIENAAPYGLYHVTNSGSCTWYEFAEAIVELASLDAEIAPVTTKYRESREKRPLAERPAYAVLDNGRLTRAGFRPLRSWRVALAEYLRRRAETQQKQQR